MRKRKLCEHGNGMDDCSRCNLICDPQCGEWYCDEKEGQIAARDAEIERLKALLDQLHGRKFSERVYDAMLAEIAGLKRKLDLFRQMAEKINSFSSERLGEPLANAILGLLAAIDEATESN